jgi:GNAT superfamily N-acetyltransferase
MSFRLRDFDPTTDRAAALSFIDGSQAYEHAFEADRRIDSTVANDYLAALMGNVADQQGRVWVAEDAGQVIGWGVFVIGQSEVFVVEEQRNHGHIAELYVVEAFRGRGVGQAMIAACEAETRRLGLTHVTIGLLAANRRAADVYARAGYAPYAMELRKHL